jgi:hypothetical protein
MSASTPNHSEPTEVAHFKDVNCYLRMSKSNREGIMGIFGDIMSKIFGQSAKAETPAAGTAAPSASTAPQASPAPSGTMTRTGPAPEGPKVEWSAPVDVKAVLRELAKSKKQKLNYDKSIVDLLKLLDLDSSLTARQELAKELGYSGNTKGSSKMNVWLHKEVMRQLAANGGKVPKTWMA